MRRPIAILLAAAAAVGVPASPAQAVHEETADRLRDDPVYVARGADPSISAAEAGRLRVRIARRDTGRIKVAVVSASAARQAGGLQPLANGVDRELRAKGNLVLVAGRSFHLITSYPQVAPAVAALREAVTANRERGLAAQLLAAVDGLAEADPGPRADGPEGAAGVRAPPPVDDATDEVLGVFRLAVLIVAAAIALPFVLLGGWLLLRLRKRRAEEAEVLAEDRQAARDELIVLGEEIGALDIDVSMPNAPAAGRQAYERALRQYELADTGLPKATTSRRLAKVKEALAEGRSQIEAAKAALGGAGGT